MSSQFLSDLLTECRATLSKLPYVIPLEELISSDWDPQLSRLSKNKTDRQLLFTAWIFQDSISSYISFDITHLACLLRRRYLCGHQVDSIHRRYGILIIIFLIHTWKCIGDI